MISASIAFFFSPAVVAQEAVLEKAMEIILEAVPFTEAEVQNEKGLTVYLGYVNYDYHSEILDALKDAKIEAECIVNEVSDTSIENFTTTLTNVDGEMVLSTLNYSGELVIEALNQCLEQISNGVSMDELKAFIEEKIKKTC